MKAMVLKQVDGPLVWQDVPDREPGPAEVLVRVRANGVCATDLKIVDGLVPSVSLPHVLGHEAAGGGGAINPAQNGWFAGHCWGSGKITNLRGLAQHRLFRGSAGPEENKTLTPPRVKKP